MTVASLIEERSRWTELFERMLVELSSGDFEVTLSQAKEKFFEKLGRSHEKQEDRYESVSQTFLEWYLFDYPIVHLEKPPALVYLTREMGSSADRRELKEALRQTWSLFEVLEAKPGAVILQDLLWPVKRTIFYETQDPVCRVWKVQPKQVIQARLFPSRQEGLWVYSHLWLHAQTEVEVLKQVCRAYGSSDYRPSWDLPPNFLRECLECLLKSLVVQDQMRAAHSSNWVYRELSKKYAA